MGRSTLDWTGHRECEQVGLRGRARAGDVADHVGEAMSSAGTARKEGEAGALGVHWVARIISPSPVPESAGANWKAGRPIIRAEPLRVG